jgi:hypothetical protein
MFSTPYAKVTKLKFTGKLLIFVISNVFSVVSPSITFEKDIKPFSGAIVTSGLTPLPFKATETIVEPE